MLPSVIVSNLSSESSIVSRLNVVWSNLSMANDFSSTCARFGLVAGAQQLHAQRRERAHIVRIDLERLAAQHHRFFEPVVRRGQLGRHAIGAAEPRIDLQRGRGFLLQVGW